MGEVKEGTKTMSMVRDMMKDLYEMIKAEITAFINESYYAKKDERHAAALKCLDKNGDGKLQLTEFVRAFDDLPQREFIKALGVDVTTSRLDTGPFRKIEEVIALE